MKVIKKRRKICDSWYHRGWFRFIMVIVGMDMFILGFAFAAEIDIFSFIPEMHIVFHLILGFLYMLVASFVIHYAFDYGRIKRKKHFVCHHCGHINGEENEEEEEEEKGD